MDTLEYVGTRAGVRLRVIVRLRHNMHSSTKLGPLRHYERHSPDGFNWGYAGSGPADLARSMLIDYFVRRNRMSEERAGRQAERLYQRFKFDVIAKHPMHDDLLVTETEIRGWLGE